MMNSQEMETAVRLGLNLVILIMQDNAYGMIRWKQVADGFADWGLTFSKPDFVKYAESYDAKGARVDTADGLVPALEAAFGAGGVHLVTVPVDYSENTRVLVDELRNQVPAIATGCPVIVKPPPATPLCCREFVRLVHEAGLGEPWCQTS